MILFFDTETTGLVNKAKPDSDLSQPRLVQLAAVLTTEEGNEVMSMSCIVKPDGFEIPEQASNVHGITTKMALEVGLPIDIVMGMFSSFLDLSSLNVAHNYFFDKIIINNELSRLCLNSLPSASNFCTMLATTDVCKIKNKYGKYKWPKLVEAHIHFFGEGFEGAHDALSDVKACKRVYFALKQPNRAGNELNTSSPSSVNLIGCGCDTPSSNHIIYPMNKTV